MHNQSIPPMQPYPQSVPTSIPQTTPQKTGPEGGKDMYQLTKMQEERKTAAMPTMPTLPGTTAAPSKSIPPTATVPIQLAKDFLNVVKKGNMSEILSFIGTI